MSRTGLARDRDHGQGLCGAIWSGVWLAFVGWFLLQAAAAEERYGLLNDAPCCRSHTSADSSLGVAVRRLPRVLAGSAVVMETRRFRDRAEAGRLLAERLRQYAGRDDVVVLALPRGGVPVGYEVARALGGPLGIFLVRKVGVPGHEELAMGAIATGGL